MVKKIISDKKIGALAKKVASEVKKEGIPIAKAFVFGSYAKGTATGNSDLDLCFISPKFKDTFKAEAYLRTKIYYANINLGIPIDVVAYKTADFCKDSPLINEIKKYGKELPLE